MPQFPEINVPGTGDLYARFVTAQGTIYVGTANPDEGDEAPVGFQLPNSSLLNTAAISWMEMY